MKYVKVTLDDKVILVVPHAICDAEDTCLAVGKSICDKIVQFSTNNTWFCSVKVEFYD